MFIRHYNLLTLIFAISLLSGCIGGGASTPIKYYLLEPADYANRPFEALRPLSIEIVDLHIPQYLERFHIATRVTENQLQFSEYNQWGENLRKNLLRTMARNLSKLLSTMDISTPLNRSTSTPDYRLLIHIEQFEKDSDGKIKLAAHWQLSSLSDNNKTNVFNAELESDEELDIKNYDKMITAMREQFGILSGRIAKSIIAQEN